MALLSPPSQDVYLCVEDARWIKAEIERLTAEVSDLRIIIGAALNALPFITCKSAKKNLRDAIVNFDPVSNRLPRADRLGRAEI